MKHFFILGRNPQLSREEVLAYLRGRSREHREVLFEENILIIETNEGEKFDVQEFGGVLKLGEITFEGSEKDYLDYISKEELIPSDKFSYSIFGNMEPEPIKEKFKGERRKAIIKHGRNRLSFQDGGKVNLSNAEYSLLVHQKGDTIYFGLATQNYSYEDVKKRDMGKPARREHLAISPRLSKILINLSEARPGDLLLDPFCGIGGILQEALIKGIRVSGIDKDAHAIKDAEKNLAWLKDTYKIKSAYTLKNLDSRKVPDMQFGAMASETPLGKVLKRKPNANEASQIIRNFEAFIIPIFRRLKKVKKSKAKIAITFPAIKDVRTNPQKIAEKTGMKLVMKPILESRPDQFISRDIIVFE